MKLGMIGDFHLTSHRPDRRKDDYLETLLGKLRQALDLFSNQGVHWVLQAGDFFDSPTVSNRVKSEVIQLLRSYETLRVLCCYGQHDITGHSAATVPNSPLAVLESAEAVAMLNSNPWDLLQLGTDGIYVYGASFGEDVPTPKDASGTNILVTHRMIGDRPLYPGQPLESPRAFLRQHPEYNIVLCGDYHYPFQDSYEGRLILNVGALARKTITDVDMGLKPSVAIVDTEMMEVEWIPLQVEDPEDIFDLSRDVKPLKNEVALEKLVEELRKQQTTGQTGAWQSALLAVLSEKEGLFEKQAFQEMKQELDEAMQEIAHV